jgi:hypothetical protein
MPTIKRGLSRGPQWALITGADNRVHIRAAAIALEATSPADHCGRAGAFSLAERYRLAVNDAGARAQFRECLDDERKTIRQIIAGA